MTTAEKSGEFETRPGLTYATHDSVALAGDLYLPKGAGPFPALVGVHGGGWVQGVRGQFQHWGKYLAARGVALFAVSYRLATEKEEPNIWYTDRDRGLMRARWSIAELQQRKPWDWLMSADDARQMRRAIASRSPQPEALVASRSRHEPEGQ